jgi:hypothetical protein
MNSLKMLVQKKTLGISGILNSIGYSLGSKTGNVTSITSPFENLLIFDFLMFKQLSKYSTLVKTIYGVLPIVIGAKEKSNGIPTHLSLSIQNNSEIIIAQVGICVDSVVNHPNLKLRNISGLSADKSKESAPFKLSVMSA